MKSLYASPLRVYLALAVLALLGIYSGIRLPVSLFPNSSKPNVNIEIPYGSSTADEFLNTYGKDLEGSLRAISTQTATVDAIKSTYRDHEVEYEVSFKWGVTNQNALKEVQTLMNGFAARFPEESRNNMEIWSRSRNSGFFAMSFFSDSRDLDSVYELLEPILSPKLAKVVDAANPELYNPSTKEIQIELKPTVMAALQLFPRDIQAALDSALDSRSGGSVSTGTQQFSIQMPRRIRSVEDISSINIPTPAGRTVHLSELAHIDIGPRSIGSRSFKTNGTSSLILFSVPKPGGNVKKMSEDILKIIDELKPSLPKDIQYRVLVDPSQFIRSAVNNVLHEVGIAALLAVFVLFMFIGSFRNVITAAIEIPLSMVLAFILMRLSGMNLNLISLGGLALSAGMNVDASVVVMENIFRHFEANPGPHNFSARLSIISKAVSEVRFAVIASTIASLVVFLPLTLTSDLSFAILGDLALAVVFSHGFSAFVALILVPTIRLQLMSKENAASHPTSPIEKYLKRLENRYSTLLDKFISSPKLKLCSYFGLTVILTGLIVGVIPRLPKEIVGKPDTDWIILGVNTEGNTLFKQMEVLAEKIGKELLDEYGSKVQYTFDQIQGPNSAYLMVRLKHKSEMRDFLKAIEGRFTNTPFVKFWAEAWNPSELPIPNPPHLRIAIRGGDTHTRTETARALNDLLQEKKILPRVWTEPNTSRSENILLSPHIEQWASLKNNGARLLTSDLPDILRVATDGKNVGFLPQRLNRTQIIMRYPLNTVSSIEEVESFPIGIGNKLIPLKALANVRIAEATPSIYREDEREVCLVEGKEASGEENKGSDSIKIVTEKARLLVEEYKTTKLQIPNAPSISFEEPAKELNDAIQQLSFAVGLSIVLIFLTMIFQFGSFIEPLLVLVSIPLGFIGVLISLFIFQSTLSLNSILGVILLNGIAVANSILLVDFTKRLKADGHSPKSAALTAAKLRLRPILITSMTTILGMLPIAIGAGEGGRILQPLGIAVAGGLWISMILTLFLVPTLHVSYLEWNETQGFQLFKTWNGFNLKLPRLARIKTLFLVFLFFLFFLMFPWMSPIAYSSSIEEAPLNFDTALSRIIGRSTAIEAQQATSAGTAAKNLSSTLSLLPTLSVNANQVYRRSWETQLTLGRRTAEVSASLNLFKFGGDFAAMSAASSENESQEILTEDTILKVEFDGSKAIFSVIQSNLNVQTLTRILKSRESALKIAESRFEKGLLARQEADKFRVDYDNAYSQLNDAEIDLVRTKAELRILLGSDLIEISWPWKSTLPKKQTLGKALSTEKWVSQRPDWRAAELKLKASESRSSQAWGGIFPSLDLTASYGYSENFNPIPRLGGTEMQGMLQLSIPLFDRLANVGNYRAQSQLKRVAELELERIKRVAKSELEASQTSLEISVESAERREKNLLLSRKLYETNLLRFQRALVNANELLNDQDRLYQSELNAIKGWNDSHLNWIRFCHSAGRRIANCTF